MGATMTDKKIYTQHDLEIALLRNTQEGILGQIARIDERVDNSFRELRSEMKSNFHMLLGTIGGLYITVLGTLLTAFAKTFGWF